MNIRTQYQTEKTAGKRFADPNKRVCLKCW
jgi:hypothetical protein